MGHIFGLVLVAAGLVWLGSQKSLSAQADQVEPRPLYEILPEEVPDLHDKSIEDWKRILPAPTLTEADFDGMPNRPTAPDLSFDIYLAWTAIPPRIYAAIDMRDDVFVLTWEGERPVLNEDYVGLGVDADRSGGRFQGYQEPDCAGSYEEWVELEEWDCFPLTYYSNRQAQMWEVLLPAGLGADLALPHRPWVAEVPWSDAGGAVVEDGASAVIELMVTPFDICDFRGPEESVVSTLTPGQIISLVLFLDDYDIDEPDTHSPDHGLCYLRWIDFSVSDDFEPFILVPATARPTAIEEESWYRVKKSLE